MSARPDDARYGANYVALVCWSLEFQRVDGNRDKFLMRELASCHSGGRVHNRHQTASEQSIERIRVARKYLIQQHDGFGGARFSHLSRFVPRAHPP